MFKKKLISLGIAVIFTLSSLTTTVFASGFSNISPGTNAAMNFMKPGKGNEKIKNNNKDSNKSYKFIDSKDVDWAFDAIEKLAGKGILKGLANGKYAPKNNVTHVEALTMVMRLTGDDKEADSLGNKLHPYYIGIMPIWGYGYIYLAMEKGILLPEELKDFNPNKPAKRHEIAKYIIRAMGENDEALDYMDEELDFKDADAVPEKSIGYVYLISKLKIMVGDNNNKFNPMVPVTRAEMAVLLDRAEGKFDLPDTDNRKNGTVFISTDEDDNEITVTINGTKYTYEYLDDVNVYRDNEISEIDDLVKGDILKLYFNENKKIIFIEVKTNAGDVDDTETKITFSAVSYKNLPDVLKDEVDDLKSKENYKAYKYDNYIYLLAAMGKKNTGGYSINIEKLSKVQDDGEYTVTAAVRTKEPKSGSTVTQAITYPYTIVKFKSFEDIEEVLFVDEDGDEIEDSQIEDINEVSVIKGEIYDLSSGSRKIYIKKSNGSKVSYVIPSDAEIIVNDDDAEFSDLEEGMNAEIELIDNKVTKVTAEEPEYEEISFKDVDYSDLESRLKDQVDYLKLNKNYKAYEYDNYVYIIASLGKKTSDGYEISIDNLYKVEKDDKYTIEAEVSINTPSSTKGNKTVYPYTVIRFKHFDDIEAVKFIDEENNKLAEVKITELDKEVEVEGIISSINSGNKTIKVKKADNSFVTLTIPSDAEITVNDDDARFADLKVGMKAETKIIGETVTGVIAEDDITEVTGTLTGISISTLKKITLKVGSNTKTYTISQDVEVIIDDETERIEDLKINSELTLRFKNGNLFEIEAE